MYDQKTNRHLGETNSVSSERTVCGIHCAGRHFMDKYGDEWILSARGDTVMRVRDGHLGGYFRGQGLKELPSN